MTSRTPSGIPSSLTLVTFPIHRPLSGSRRAAGRAFLWIVVRGKFFQTNRTLSP